MKIKTAILTGKALRYAVALCLDMSFYKIEDLEWPDDKYWVVQKDGTISHAIEDTGTYAMNRHYVYQDFEPDNDGEQADTLMEKFRISTVWDSCQWIASMFDPDPSKPQPAWRFHQSATSRKVAAMRTLVEFHFGAEVDLPNGVACTE